MRNASAQPRPPSRGPSAQVEDEAIALTVTVTNTGSRAGKQVVQVYAARPESAVDLPVRWLVGSAVVRTEAGGTVTTHVTVPLRALAHEDGEWQLEPGSFRLRAGFEVGALHTAVDVTVPR